MKPPGPDAAGTKLTERGSSRSEAQRSKFAPEVPGRVPDAPKPGRRDRLRGAGKAATIVGVVLAGGRSSRLGRRKAALRLPGPVPGAAGPTLTEWAATRLASVNQVGEVVVAAGRADIDAWSIEVAGADERVPVSVTTDGPGAGPAAGVLGAARARPGRRLLVLACDLPLAPVELLAALADSRAEIAAATTAPRDPRSLNPTCALWRPAALERLATRVERGDYRLYPLTRCADLCVEPVDARRDGVPESVLLNVNTAAEWRRARTAWRRLPRRGSSGEGEAP